MWGIRREPRRMPHFYSIAFLTYATTTSSCIRRSRSPGYRAFFSR